MAKFLVILFCLSAGCFLWTEASPFFFNIQKSYVSQPAQANSQTTVSQSVDFGLSGLVSKWLALSQIFTDKLVGKTQQRPRPTQRPVVEVDSVYKPEKLSTTTTESPAELIGTTTDRSRTTEESTTKFTTTERSTTSDRFTTTERSTTERSSTSSYSTERSTTSDRFTTTEGSTTERSSTSASTTTKPATDDTDIDTDGSDKNGETAFTTDRTTTSTTRRTTSYTDRTTNGYEYTTPSTTRRTTPFSILDRSTNGYDINAPYTTDRTTSPFSTADRTTTPHGYEYNTPSTPYTTVDRTTSPRGYEYPTPSTTIRPTSLRPTTSDNDNEIYTGEEDNASGVKKPSTTTEQVPSRTYLPPIMTRFSSASNKAVSANAIPRGRVSPGRLPENAIFKGTVSANSVSIGDSSSQSANARPFDILSQNEEGDSDNDQGFQGTDDVNTGGIDPRVYYFY